MKKVNFQEADQHIANLQHMLQRIQSVPGITHPTLQHAAEDFLANGIAETKREMKNSRRTGRLSFRELLKNFVTKILPQREPEWKRVLRQDPF